MAQVFSPGDFVCKKGDIGNEMFVVKRGMLNVVSDDGTKVFVTLKAGAFFGELSILNIPCIRTGNRRTANVRSVGYSDLLRLTKEDLWHVLSDYEADRRAVIRKGLEKVVRDNLLEERFAEKFQSSGDCDWSEQLDGIEFNSLRSDEKLERLHGVYERLLREVEAMEREFLEDCQSVESKLELLRGFYRPMIGTTV